ncbi:MAG TPA: hypothetical protein VEH79_05010 [Gaiellaceae bacterium]|nr:hypothetical protein [Gaiellaceae bacterium]
MTTTLSPPIRILGIVGILAAAALGLLLLSQHRSSHSSSASLPNVTPTHHSAAGSAVKPTQKPATPKLELAPGLPAPVAHALRYSKIVVVALYSAGVPSDGAALQQARQGAAAAHSGFAAVNVLNERVAKGLDKFAGTVSTPAVLVVRRPGKIVNQFGGYTDDQIVAQAAQNAGAGR